MECQIKGIPVYYDTRGEGRPLLMLHGLPTDHRHMMRDFEPFFKHRSGWKRIYIDLPGMGRTPGAAVIENQDAMLGVLTEFIDRVIEGERFVVAGTSYGGYLARGVLHRRAFQIDGLFLLVPQVPGILTEALRTRPKTLVTDADLRLELAADELEAFEWMVVARSRLPSS